METVTQLRPNMENVIGTDVKLGGEVVGKVIDYEKETGKATIQINSQEWSEKILDKMQSPTVGVSSRSLQPDNGMTKIKFVVPIGDTKNGGKFGNNIMKKKFREITVDGVMYGWTIHNNCDGDGGNCISIWYDKKIVYQEIIDYNVDITPKLVSELIKEWEENDIPTCHSETVKEWEEKNGRGFWGSEEHGYFYGEQNK